MHMCIISVHLIHIFIHILWIKDKNEGIRMQGK